MKPAPHKQAVDDKVRPEVRASTYFSVAGIPGSTTRVHRPDSDKTRPSHAACLEQFMSYPISQAPQTHLAQNYADMLIDMQTRIVISRRSRKSSSFSQPFAPSPPFYPSHCSRWVMSVSVVLAGADSAASLLGRKNTHPSMAASILMVSDFELAMPLDCAMWI